MISAERIADLTDPLQKQSIMTVSFSTTGPLPVNSVQPVSEHFVGVLARHARRAVDDCRSAREPGGRGRLGYAIADEKGVAGCQLRMARRIAHAEYGCHAGVAVAEYLCPLLLRARGEGGVIAIDAAACVRPTTLGTVACAGPEETTRFTAEP